MVWEPLKPGGSWVELFDQEIRDRFQFVKRLVAVDAEVTGAFTAGRGQISDSFTIGNPATDTAWMVFDPNIAFNTLYFHHENHATASWNKDNRGSISSVSTGSGASLLLSPAYDTGQKRPSVSIHETQGVVFLDQGITTDTHLSEVIAVNPSEVDTIGVTVENTASATITAPLLKLDASGQNAIWLNAVDGATRRVSLEEDAGSGGLLTNQANGFLPAIEYDEPADYTTDTSDTFQTMGVATRPVISHGSGSNKVRAFATGQVTAQQLTSGSATARVVVRISLDGGSTWTNGAGALGSLVFGTVDYVPFAVQVELEGTPTGNIVAELRVRSDSANTDFINGSIRLEAYGDI